MLQATDTLPAQHRPHRQGQHVAAPTGSSIRSAPAPSASSSTRTGARRRRAIDCCLGDRRGRGRPGHDPHRHAERVGLRRRLDRRVQGPDDPHLPLGGRRRRPRARTSCASCGEPNVLPSSTNPTRPFTVNTLDEHLDMLMVCHHLDREHPRGRRVRREPHPRRDHRRRGRAPRSRRASASSRATARRWAASARSISRTWQTAAQDEGRARPPRRGERRQRQPPRAALHREVHDQPGDRARHGARDRLGRGRQAGRPRAVAAGVLRHQARARAQGRLHRLGADGRSQRVDPDAAALVHAADVRRARARERRDEHRVRLAARASPRATSRRSASRSASIDVRGCRGIGKARHEAQRRAARR